MGDGPQGAAALPHDYDFDPTHGYDIEALLKVGVPQEPDDYAEFWEARYRRAVGVASKPVVEATERHLNGWRVSDLRYVSTDGVEIGGWLLVPSDGVVERGMVVGHGYGGRASPDFHWIMPGTALLYLCCRGLGRSTLPDVAEPGHGHVLHGIDDRDAYIHGGCVEDTWMGVSALLELFPQVEGRVGYMGGSFGGGIGALALPWEPRIMRAQLGVPSFGNQPLRMQLATVGSGASVQKYYGDHPEVLDLLAYYDAAVAARRVAIPVQCACALFDPAVAPAGQFAVYNALPGERALFVLSAGHYTHDESPVEQRCLHRQVEAFFASL
ncbi:MAG: acetylxylan esterase [Candidatus Latescibacteria bacterium]|nr:acetylxylan esterase [Candidatus Latescibacterota bacterium]